jgi:cell division protein FtsB
MLPSQLEEAEEYVNIASKLSDNETIYGMKAQIAFIKGDYEQADSLWKCALCSNALDYNLSTLEMITNMYAVNHEYEKAYKASLKKDSVNTLINKKRLSDNALEVQKKYDFELQVLRFREKLNITIFVLIAIVLCTISLFVYSRYKANKATKDALENQMLINIYSKQLSQMKDSSKEKASEIDNLQNKISELNKKQSSILYEGKKLYDEIIGGGTVVLWGKNEFNHFIEYFKLIDLPFVVQLETEYMELSPRYKFFSILTHMGKSDDEIERIMGISYNTIRSTRTRIKMKKKCI